ncbi:MFS transporter [Gordonia sp. PKS22-38]|uniref:Multidrug efflux pump Tap n=1 Tax=Gordonia prachuapensis TaxID=3115651 RepID=A0ABU7MX82_9ACTN|nr:MFS transporter [Gordonia sp. PKS22-38]
MAALLRNATFRRLYAAQVVSLLGTGLLTVALGLVAYDLAGGEAGQVLGIALAIKMVAYVVMGPVMHAACVRAPTVVVLVGADVIRCAAVMVMPWVGEVWQIYLLVFVMQTASAAFTPTFQAVIPRVVPAQDDYTRAISASRIAYDLEAVASPLVAAALLTVVDHSVLFLGTALGFAASGVLVLRANRRSTNLARSADTRLRFVDRMTDGTRIMVSRPVFQGLLGANLVSAAATALVLVGSVLYVRSTLAMSAAALAVALAVFGAGSIVAAVVLPALLRRYSASALLTAGGVVCVVGLAAATAALAQSLPFILLCVAWFALGAGTGVVNTAAPRLIRDHTDESTRDSVFAAQFSASHCAFLLTYPLTGLLVAVGWSAPVVLGGLAVVGTLVSACRRPVRATARSDRGHAGSPTMSNEAIPG